MMHEEAERWSLLEELAWLLFGPVEAVLHAWRRFQCYRHGHQWEYGVSGDATCTRCYLGWWDQ